MRALMVVIIFGMFAAWLTSIYELDKLDRTTEATRLGAAINFVQYREGAMRYAFFYKDASDGEIPAHEILNFLPDTWTMYPRRQWRARIDGGYVYVWGEASPEEIEHVTRMLGHSPSVGENQNGRLRPGDIPLPGFIPNGSVVASFGSNRYRPDNENYPN